MLVAITGPVALNLITEKSPNLDQSNITVVVDFPGALFPVSVIRFAKRKISLAFKRTCRSAERALVTVLLHITH